MKAHELFDSVAAHPCGAARATAGGAGDNTAVTGQTIDTDGFDGDCMLVISGKAALADTESLSIACELQESADGSSWDTAEAIETSTVVVTSAGGTTEHIARQYQVDLQGGGQARKRYIRFNFTPNLSASGTDTADLSACAILSGNKNKSARTSPTTSTVSV
jgi:hypothetical protein